MPPGVPVATVAISGGRNAGILAAQILAIGDARVAGGIEKIQGAAHGRIAREEQESGAVIVAAVRLAYKLRFSCYDC